MTGVRSKWGLCNMSDLALLGGTPVHSGNWPRWPVASEEGIRAVEEVLRSTQWSRGNGVEVRSFENRFAEHAGAAYGLAVSSGTAALEVAVRSLNLTRGAEVILSPFTFMASATSILMARCVPIFVDVDPETYNINPSRIEAAITDRTEAIMAVHFGGLPCDMAAILEIGRRYGLRVIEDCSHAHGGSWNGMTLGTIGDVGAFSLGAAKNLTGGEGGVVITNQEKIYWNCVDYHDLWSGSIRERLGIFRYLSWNYRLSEMQGALLNANLDLLEDQASHRSINGHFLTTVLENMAGTTPLRHDPYVTRNAYHIFTFRYHSDDFDGLPRSAFAEALKAEGVPVSTGYERDCRKQPFFLDPAVDLQKVWPRDGAVDVDYRAMTCPKSEWLCEEETIWIGQAVLLAERSEVAKIGEAIDKIFTNRRELLEVAAPL